MSHLPIELSPFQQWLTRSKGFTSQEAIDLCTIGSHDDYVRLWREWEGFRMSIILISEMPTQPQRVFL